MTVSVRARRLVSCFLSPVQMRIRYTIERDRKRRINCYHRNYCLPLKEKHFFQVIYYFGGARSKGFATLRNVSKLQFFDKIGHAKSVGFRFYSAI